MATNTIIFFIGLIIGLVIMAMSVMAADEYRCEQCERCTVVRCRECEYCEDRSFEEYIKKSDVIDILSTIPSDQIEEYIWMLKGIHIDEEVDEMEGEKNDGKRI